MNERNHYIICAGYAGLLAWFSFKSNAIVQLLLMVGVLAILFALAIAVRHAGRHWSQGRLRSLLPLCVLVLVFLVPGPLARTLRDTYFRSIIPELQVQVDDFIRMGTVPEPSHGFYGTIYLDTLPTGDITVTYWWGSGFPVKHTALMYCSFESERPSFKGTGWTGGYEVQENWLYVKD